MTGLGRVLVVRMRQETDAPSPLHGVQGVDPSDQGAMARSGKGLWLGAPTGTCAALAVEV